MATRGRKPNVATDVIVQSIFESAEGALKAAELGINSARANTLVEQGILSLRSATVRVTNEDGTPSRGRPAHQFGLSRKMRDKARRQAAKQAA